MWWKATRNDRPNLKTKLANGLKNVSLHCKFGWWRPLHCKFQATE